MTRSASLSLFVFLVASTAWAQKLPLERIFEDPSLDGLAPRDVKVSPDGGRVTYLKGKEADFQRLDLWEFDVAAGKDRLLVDSSDFLKGEEKLSDEEKARRERMRLSNSSGIVEYSWSKGGDALIFPLAGGLFYAAIGEGKPRITRLTGGKSHEPEHEPEHETDAHVSFHGKYVSFVRNSDLYLYDVAKHAEHRLTRDGSKLVKYGIAEFIAQEEMDRFDGQWWSDDEKHLALTRTDDSDVEVDRRFEIGANGVEVYDQRYPRTGTKNARIKLGIVDVGAGGAPGRIRWLDLGPDKEAYLARVDWLPGGEALAVQLESRDQKKLELVFYDTKTLRPRKILTETDAHWINLNDDLRFLKRSRAFIWGSERSGFKHLYLYHDDGKFLRTLTSGEWPVHEVLAVDPGEKFVYFTASRETPLESHLYKASLNGIAGGEFEIARITREEGVHEISMSDDARTYVDSYSNPMQPVQVSIHKADGTFVKFVSENKIDEHHPLWPYLSDFSKPEFGSFTNDAGVELYYEILKPKDYNPSKKYPVLVDVYGGPHVQVVEKAWSRKHFLWHQVLAQAGFVVFSLDNRGSANRGHAFEVPIQNQLGEVEVRDQKAGVEFLISKGIADPARVGVFGWSYGGFMALMTLLKEPGVFKAAVSVAPVTDWTLYDTFYTERLLGTPSGNPEGYRKSDISQYVDQLRGKLLMMHGMSDDNVFFTNSTKIYKALQDRALPFEMMVYPGAKHGIAGKKPQTHVFMTVTNFLKNALR